MDFIGQIIAQTIVFFSDKVIYAWQTVSYLDISIYQIIVDILVVSVLFYWLIMWVRGTKAKQILSGLGLLGLMYIASRAFNLIALGWLLQNFFTVVLIAIPIIFQEEIRRGLSRLGEVRIFTSTSHVSDNVIKEVVQAAFDLADKKLGALIVFKRDVNLDEYESTGVEIDSKVSAALLESIFHTKSPLHDGAIIIHGNRLKIASSILPQSIKKIVGKFGTRHKAALTLSEYTDAVIVVVSEERKTVSFVIDGQIHQKLSPLQLTTFLKSNL